MAPTVILTLAEACTAHKKDIERYVPLADCPTAMRCCLQPHDIRTLVNVNSSVVNSIGVFHGPLKVTREVAPNFEVRARTALARFASTLTHS